MRCPVAAKGEEHHERDRNSCCIPIRRDHLEKRRPTPHGDQRGDGSNQPNVNQPALEIPFYVQDGAEIGQSNNDDYGENCPS